jgi:hypothetical protein
VHEERDERLGGRRLQRVGPERRARRSLVQSGRDVPEGRAPVRARVPVVGREAEGGDVRLVEQGDLLRVE